MKVLPPLDETRMEVAEPAPAPAPLAAKRSASSSSGGSGRGNRSMSCDPCRKSKVRAYVGHAIYLSSGSAGWGGDDAPVAPSGGRETRRF